MSDLSDLLERASRTVDLEPDDFQRLVRRRDRKRRNERIKAGVLVIVVFAATVWIVRDVAIIDPDRAPIIAGGSPNTDPFVSINAQIANDAPPIDLFTVRADHAEYWRMYTLDHFDGESWTSTNSDGSAGVAISLPGLLREPDDTPPPGAVTLDQTVWVVRQIPGPAALPMAQTPIEITASSFDDVMWDPVRDQAFVDGGLEPGTEYTVRSQIVVPTPEELAALQYGSSPSSGPWTQLPDDLEARITQIAEKWTVGADSDYEKILDIQRQFHDGDFTYSTDVAPLDGEDGLLQFVTTTKVGFCQQYASAMATLVRALGIPARIAVGYQAGTLQDDGTYLVSTRDAHAWVEVRFPTYGWLPFEPTPGRGSLPNAASGSYLNPVAPPGAS